MDLKSPQKFDLDELAFINELGSGHVVDINILFFS